MSYKKLSMLELVDEFCNMTHYSKETFYATEIVRNPLTLERFLRIRARTKTADKLILWFYERDDEMVCTNVHRSYRVKEFDFKTYDDEVMSIHILFELGYRVREIGAFTGYSPSTCRRRDNEFMNTSAYPATKYSKFKKKQFGNFRK